MKLTPRIVMEIAHHEAIIRRAYKDSVGVWTWSAGLTSMSGHNVEQYIDKPQTMQKCLEVYINILETKYLPSVLAAFEGFELTDSQLAAALSFHWNTGAIRRASWVKHFRAGDMAASKRAFMYWKKPAEIIPRRRAERDLFFDGKWSGKETIGEYTRLTSRYAPVWSSRIEVNVSKEIKALLGAVDPQPEAPNIAEVSSTRELPSWLVALLSIFKRRPT